MDIKKGVLTLQPVLNVGDLILISSNFNEDKNGNYFVMKTSLDVSTKYSLTSPRGKVWRNKEFSTLEELTDQLTQFHEKESFEVYPARSYKLVVSPKKEGS